MLFIVIEITKAFNKDDIIYISVVLGKLLIIIVYYYILIKLDVGVSINCVLV